MNTNAVRRAVVFSLLMPLTLMAQTQTDVIPLSHWPAPLYWQSNQAESQAAYASKHDALTINDANQNLQTA